MPTNNYSRRRCGVAIAVDGAHCWATDAAGRPGDAAISAFALLHTLCYPCLVVLGPATPLPAQHCWGIVEAMRRIPERQLIVVGNGPPKDSLRRSAPTNVTSLRNVDESHLLWLHAECDLLIQASYEDFALTLIEAVSGRPTVVLHAGGLMDTDLEGTTGAFFDVPDADHVANAIDRGYVLSWDPNTGRAHAEGFSVNRFTARLKSFLHEESAA